MTKEQKIEAIQGKCIEANPEIVELKFGCVVRFMGPKTILGVEGDIIRYVVRREEAQWESGGEFHKERVEKIIGRPIRLADVLLCVGEEIYIYRIGDNVYFSSTQEDISQGAYWKSWSLHKDTLSEQSSETINLIAELLNVA